jgi:hypothetical protein
VRLLADRCLYCIDTTNDNAPPGAFNKTSPVNGSMGQSRAPQFYWGPSAAATRYEWCLGTSQEACGNNWIIGFPGSGGSGLPWTTYYWQVRAINGVGTTYADGSSTAFWSFKTLGPFTDDPLTQGTLVKSLHVSQLRERIDALRAAHGLPAYNWADPNLAVGFSVVRAQHLLDLRTALAQAYIAAGRTPPSYTDPGLGAGLTIRTAHIAELRAAVAALQ